MTEQMDVKFAGALVALAFVLGMFIGYFTGVELTGQMFADVARESLSSAVIDADLNFNETAIVDAMCERIPECSPGDIS